jgi:GT2 family glycosyltransferase
MLSLCEASPPPGEIIVIVDGGEDDSWAVAQKPGVRVIRETLRGGPAKARNGGGREATGEIILFIDADVVVPSDLFGRVAQIFGQEPDLAAVIGSYDDEPAATNFFSLYKNLFHHFIHQNADTQASTFWGACGAVRREIFLASGGFDESYGKPSIEDIELGYRLGVAGYRIKLDKSLQVKHLKRWSVVSLLKTDFFRRALPWSELILRKRLLINDLNLRISSRISVFATFGMFAAAGGALFQPQLLAVSAGLFLLLLTLNARLLLFFYRKGGPWFAVRAMAWHCLYYFYSGLAFAVAVGRLLVHRR